MWDRGPVGKKCVGQGSRDLHGSLWRELLGRGGGLEGTGGLVGRRCIGHGSTEGHGEKGEGCCERRASPLAGIWRPMLLRKAMSSLRSVQGLKVGRGGYLAVANRPCYVPLKRSCETLQRAYQEHLAGRLDQICLLHSKHQLSTLLRCEPEYPHKSPSLYSEPQN